MAWTKYDEWRPSSDVVDTTVETEESDALNLLKVDLSVKIKENLNFSRVRDTEITLHRQVFETYST